MKKYRIINAAIWATIALVIISCVIYQWGYKNACGAKSVILAVAYYSATIFALAYTIDASIVEANK